jgi:CheY-specific phosphatase CheX
VLEVLPDITREVFSVLMQMDVTEVAADRAIARRDLHALITLTLEEGQGGSLIVGMPASLARRCQEQLLGESDDEGMQDLVGEVANNIAGLVLARTGLSGTISLPNLVIGATRLIRLTGSFEARTVAFACGQDHFTVHVHMKGQEESRVLPPIG